MLQYTPDNWPYDGNRDNLRAAGKTSLPAALVLIVLEPTAAANSQIGCFKAKQMAYFREQCIKNHI
ncbi:hypothetical protein [Sporomusa aerivorans]|uniref:hypothetical protein n=1 Tax=Sporomusa aerivorans TaxID=204936 RepID=UPI003529EAC7